MEERASTAAPAGRSSSSGSSAATRTSGAWSGATAGTASATAIASSAKSGGHKGVGRVRKAFWCCPGCIADICAFVLPIEVTLIDERARVWGQSISRNQPTFLCVNYVFPVTWDSVRPHICFRSITHRRRRTSFSNSTASQVC